MNKKFFAALASATMAFTASGSIAVFADDFVEENTPVVDGNVTPLPEKVKWNQENFGDLATKEGGIGNVTFSTNPTITDGYVKTEDLKGITTITLKDNFNGEIKGLEYFKKLDTFAVNDASKVTNTKLDFSANTLVTSLTVKNAEDLTEIVLPEAFVDEDKKETFKLETLDLENTKLTALDLSKQEGLKTLTVKDSKLKALDLSALKLDNVTVTDNSNLEEVTLNNGKPGDRAGLKSLNLSGNALETVNLDYIDFGTTGTLDLTNNHIGVLDLSKTTIDGNPNKVKLTGQTFYISHEFGSVNLAKTFENFDVEKVVETSAFNAKTGVLTIENDETTYKYVTGKGKLEVTLTKANPMNRLYNPNSGEHFYTADLEEKEALVKLGWQDEGYGWVAPKDKTGTDKDVYRLYNPNAGDHHYTTNSEEVKTLVAYGWKDEGKGWISAEDNSRNGKTVPVYRQYNPFANGAGSHNYTTDKAENDYLVSLGWTPEGTAWYGLK